MIQRDEGYDFDHENAKDTLKKGRVDFDGRIKKDLESRFEEWVKSWSKLNEFARSEGEDIYYGRNEYGFNNSNKEMKIIAAAEYLYDYLSSHREIQNRLSINNEPEDEVFFDIISNMVYGMVTGGANYVEQKAFSEPYNLLGEIYQEEF